jgi:hypothetical protein
MHLQRSGVDHEGRLIRFETLVELAQPTGLP